MKNKLLILVLSISLIGSVLPVPVVHASTIEEQQEEVISKIEKLKEQKKNTDSETKELKASSNSVQTTINSLDKQANSAAAEINSLDNQIDDKLAEIEEKEAEIEVMQEKLDEQYANMKSRICYMYENGIDLSYIGALLSGDSFSDALNKVEYAYTLTSYDRQMFEEFLNTKNQLDKEKTTLESEKTELENLKAESEKKKKELDALISKKSNELANYKNQIAENTKESQAYADEILKQEKALEAIEAQIAAAAAAVSDGENEISASGFIWPCPSSRRITSSFGPRTAPVAGASTYHKGIDIGASSGSAIVAAASGTVTTAQYSSSAGNYIVISHGGGMSTVYMHCSALYVSVGQKVNQGDKIGAVGSTGYSTGPHLHFGIIKNGSYVNPMNYL